MNIIGIDPGVNGALVLMEDGVPVRFEEMPSKKNTRKKAVLDEQALAEIIRSMVEQCPERPVVVMENPQPFKTGVSGAFQYGKTVGATVGIVAGLFLEYHLVVPWQWKKAAGLIKAEKDDSRKLAKRLWPLHNFRLKKSVDKAEAALIGLYGAQIKGVTP